MRRINYLFVPVLALAAACAETETEQAGSMQDTMPADGAAATTPSGNTLSDAQIVHVLGVANTADIQGGEVAEKKAQNAEVKSFGQLMVTDHTALNEQGNQLAERLNLSPEANQTSEQLRTEHAQAAERLNGLNGAEFDRAYIDHEVQMHQKLLTMIDSQILPNAQNAELRTMLEQGRAKIQEHLTKAQQIQQSLTQQASAQ